MESKKVVSRDGHFIMSPKVDFAFKMLFGEERNKGLLQSFIAAVLNVPKSDLEGLQIHNPELPKYFEADKKGILDVRVLLKSKEQIDIEIQVNQTNYMHERSLFYWSKMYGSQLEMGEDYCKLEKCIMINILDFKYNDLEDYRTIYRLLEHQHHTKISPKDKLEIHFLELPKIKNIISEKTDDAPDIIWMKFIGAEDREVMANMAKTNEDLQKAFEILDELSQDRALMDAYLSRQMAIFDERTRLKEATELGVRLGIEQGIEQGIDQGIEQGKIEMAKVLLENGMSLEEVVKLSGLTTEQIQATYSIVDNKH